MRKSHYFGDLIRTSMDEVDDLLSDSEGKSVLQKRLNEKRREIGAILPMIDYSPEMVAVIFYGAFGFKAPGVMQKLILSDPISSGFLPWRMLREELTIADWAEPLIATTLKNPSGDEFLVTTAGLEFLRTKDTSDATVSAADDSHEAGDEDRDDDDETQDLSEAGADWLAEQGFDSLTH